MLGTSINNTESEIKREFPRVTKVIVMVPELKTRLVLPEARRLPGHSKKTRQKHKPALKIKPAHSARVLSPNEHDGNTADAKVLF